MVSPFGGSLAGSVFDFGPGRFASTLLEVMVNLTGVDVAWGTEIRATGTTGEIVGGTDLGGVIGWVASPRPDTATRLITCDVIAALVAHDTVDRAPTLIGAKTVAGTGTGRLVITDEIKLVDVVERTAAPLIANSDWLVVLLT